MKKRITTLMMTLACCAGSMQAQTVASTPTAPSDIRGGYYVMVMKTQDSRTDNTNGNFVYYGADDKCAHFDEVSASENDLRSTTLSKDQFKYVFAISGSDGKISVKAYGTNYYWPAIPAAEKSDSKCNPSEQSVFVSSTSPATFDVVTNDDWFFLHVPAKKYTKIVWVWSESEVTACVKINGDNLYKLGYWDDADKTANKCQFQIYAVDDMPEPGEVATITYNYVYGGEVRGTTTFGDARVGRAYPDVNLSGLPDFLSASKPEGTVKGDETVDLELQLALPFEVSTDANPVYYYLGTADLENPSVFCNKKAIFPNAVGFVNLDSYYDSESFVVNDIVNSLWYVSGDPFSGFVFHNASTNAVARSSAVISSVFNTCLLAFDGAVGYTSVWDIRKPSSGDLQAFVVYPHGENSNCWRYSSSDVKFNYGEEYPNEFALYPPTFTFPMYSGGDGNVYNTFAAPFDVAVADDAVKMYKGLVNQNEKQLVLDEVDALPAGEGIALIGQGSDATSVTLKAVYGAGKFDEGSNDLKGITADELNLDDKLILGISDQTGAVGFFAAGSNVTSLLANHAYLERTPAVSEVKSMRISGEATAIGGVSTEVRNSDDAIYDLTGRRVMRTESKGIYIQNGRKFIAK